MMIWIWYGKCPWCTRRCGGHRICPGGCRRPDDAAGGTIHPCVQAGEVSQDLCGSSHRSSVRVTLEGYWRSRRFLVMPYHKESRTISINTMQEVL